MKKTNKSVFIKYIKSVTPEVETLTYQFGDGQEIKISVNPNLSVFEQGSIINDIVSLLFVGDSYHPYLKQTVTWYCLLKALTDLPLGDLFVHDADGVHVDENVLNIVQILITRTPIYDTIADDILGFGVYDQFQYDLDDAIEFKKRELLQSESSFDRFMGELTTLAEKLGAVADDVKNIDMDEVTKVIGKLGSIDQNKIIDFMTAKIAADKEDK